MKDKATKKAMNKIEASAFGLIAVATALMTAGKNEKAKNIVLGGLAKLTNADKFLEATGDKTPGSSSYYEDTGYLFNTLTGKLTKAS